MTVRFSSFPACVAKYKASPKTNQAHRYSRVLLQAGILIALILPSYGQNGSAALGSISLNEKPAFGTDQAESQTTPYVISVNHLRIPERAANHLEAAHKRFAKMQLEQAFVEVDRAIEIYPGFAQAFCMKALVQLAEKDFTGSLESAAHAISLDGADASSWIALATAFNSLNQWPEAEAAAGRALALNSLAWQARLELAKSYYGEGKYIPALDTLDQVAQDIPDIHLVRANSLMRIGHSQDGAREFSIFLRETPGDSRSQQIRQILSRQPAAGN